MRTSKWIGLVMVLLILLGGVVSAQDDLEPWTCPEGFEGQTLSVYNWSTYIVDEDDPETERNEDTIRNFEELCGVTVIYSIFTGNEALLTELRATDNTGYDVIVLTDYMVSIMASEGRLRPLNLDNIPNFKNLSENLTNAPYDPGNTFSIPYQWGTIGIGYNATKTGEVTSWYELFEYDGPVAWLEDGRGMLGVALLLNGFDPNTDDLDEIAQARDFLIENGRNVRAIAADDGQALLERGDVDMAVEYSGDIFQVMFDCECDDFNYVIPEEGAVIWVDNLAIPAGAANPELAEVFIDYILDPQIGADLSNFIAYASPNQVSIDLELIDAELLGNAGIYPSEAASENLFFVEQVPDVEQDYNDAWEEVKIFSGQ